VQGWLPYAVLLAVAIAAANLPFLSERILFVVRPAGGRKHAGWRLLELVLMYFATGLFARALEARQAAVHAQGWEFYAVTACLFLVLAYPGFVWRYLWKRRRI
jgi:hypothetical protein